MSPFNRHHFQIIVNNAVVQVLVNGQLKINFTDANPLLVQARIGLEAHFSHVHFDNVSVTGENNNRSYDFNTDDNDFIFGYG